jgi:hypothetical protein
MTSPSGPTAAEQEAAGWRGEVNRLDLAVNAAIAATSTPNLDRAFRRLSKAADYSKLWIASAALLAGTGGSVGRRAALYGLASTGLTSAVVSLVFKPLGGRTARARDQSPESSDHGSPRSPPRCDTVSEPVQEHTERVSRRQAAERLTDVAYALMTGGSIMLDGGRQMTVPSGDEVMLARTGTSGDRGAQVTLELSWSTAHVDS